MAPWDHRQIDAGYYEIRFREEAVGTFLFTKTTDRAGLYITEVIAGLNAGHASRLERTTSTTDVEPPAVVADPLQSYDDLPSVRAWLESHPQRTRSNGIALAEHAYFDESTAGPEHTE
jgi:hypothetical protein